MTHVTTPADITPNASKPNRSGLVVGARWTLVALAAVFTIGAFAQFFLVGLSMFEDGARWQDHKNLGHILGFLPYVMWIPAVLGKTSRGLLIGTLMLFVLFMAQYAFISVDNGVANAFHPLNGTFLLLLGSWIFRTSLDQARHGRASGKENA